MPSIYFNLIMLSHSDPILNKLEIGKKVKDPLSRRDDKWRN